MLLLVAMVLLLVWTFGLLSAALFGGALHVLVALALLVIFVEMIRRQRASA